MNTKRIIFWACFIIILALIVWGLVVAMNKPPIDTSLGTPAPITAADHIRGPENAPVTIIEYSDFECPACASYYPMVERLIAESSTTMRFVYRHFPLHPLPHKNAVIAAQAAEAAGNQGKFWEMYSELFENQIAWAGVPTVNATGIFEGYATKLGLDMTKYKTDYAASSTLARVTRDREDGDTIGVNSTPTFFINGSAIVNPRSYDEFKALIEKAATGGAN